MKWLLSWVVDVVGVGKVLGEWVDKECWSVGCGGGLVGECDLVILFIKEIKVGR